MMAGTGGCLPMVSEAVNTSRPAKAEQGQGAGARPCLAWRGCGER